MIFCELPLFNIPKERTSDHIMSSYIQAAWQLDGIIIDLSVIWNYKDMSMSDSSLSYSIWSQYYWDFFFVEACTPGDRKLCKSGNTQQVSVKKKLWTLCIWKDCRPSCWWWYHQSIDNSQHWLKVCSGPVIWWDPWNRAKEGEFRKRDILLCSVSFFVCVKNG